MRTRPLPSAGAALTVAGLTVAAAGAIPPAVLVVIGVAMTAAGALITGRAGRRPAIAPEFASALRIARRFDRPPPTAGAELLEQRAARLVDVSAGR